MRRPSFLVVSALLIGLSGCTPSAGGAVEKAPPKNARILSGKAYITDGDGITVEGYRIRLYRVDAPELSQRLLKKE